MKIRNSTNCDFYKICEKHVDKKQREKGEYFRTGARNSRVSRHVNLLFYIILANLNSNVNHLSAQKEETGEKPRFSKTKSYARRSSNACQEKKEGARKTRSMTWVSVYVGVVLCCQKNIVWERMR